MIDRDLVIPMPPGSEEPAMRGESKPVVGLYPCFGGCGQYALVKLDNSGKPYATCTDKEITRHGGCGQTKGLVDHIPEQSESVFKARLELMQKGPLPLPDAYSRYIENAWTEHLNQGGGDDECGA